MFHGTIGFKKQNHVLSFIGNAVHNKDLILYHSILCIRSGKAHLVFFSFSSFVPQRTHYYVPCFFNIKTPLYSFVYIIIVFLTEIELMVVVLQSKK